jgi:DNA-binding CsgD family transcriptional regulator
MSILRADETDLLLALHGHADAPDPWARFLMRLCQRTGADRAVLTWRPPPPLDTAAGLVDWHADPRRAAAPGLPARALRLGDPLRLLRLRPGRVYALDELCDPTNPAQTAWLAAARAEGVAPETRLVQLAPDDGAAGWLVLSRARGVFPALVSATLSDLAPHLSLALRTWARGQAQGRALALARAAAARLGVGTLWLARDGTLVEADSAALAMIEAAPGLRAAPGARLVPATAAAGRALAEALAPAPAPRAVLLHDEPRLDLLVEDHGPLVAGLMRGAGRGGLPAAATAAIARLFALTPAEARLATALASGDSLDEAAAHLALSRETARTYSKVLYRKTGARGMTDLVRLVRDSAAALTPP